MVINLCRSADRNSSVKEHRREALGARRVLGVARHLSGWLPVRRCVERILPRIPQNRLESLLPDLVTSF